MITIICGEDTAGSRSYLTDLKRKYRSQQIELQEVKPQEIEKINQWLADSPSLFSRKRVYFTEGLNKFVGRNNKKLAEELEKLKTQKDIELITWEQVSAWELKLKKFGAVKEFKPEESIFRLLDLLQPGTKSKFIFELNKLSGNQDPNFIFIMLVRSVRNLIIVKSGETPAKMQSWQAYRLKTQSAMWKMENLINFYEALFKIEVGQKTGSSPFSIKDSLEILACHFL